MSLGEWRAHKAKSYLLEQCQNTDLKEYLESKEMGGEMSAFLAHDGLLVRFRRPLRGQEKPRALPRLPRREALQANGEAGRSW